MNLMNCIPLSVGENLAGCKELESGDREADEL